MGRQRNKPECKGKEESSERVLNEIQASQLSDIELKTTVIRKLDELTHKYQNYRGATRNLLQITLASKNIETINKSQKEMKNTISELKNTGEGIKNRLHEAEDRISKLEDKVNTQKEKEKEIRLTKNEDVLRELQKNMKHNYICKMGIPEGEE